MKARVLSGVLMLIPAVYLIGWSPQWLFFVVLVVLVTRALYEYFLIARQAGFASLEWLGYAGGLAMCSAEWAAFPKALHLELYLAVLSMVLVLLLALCFARDLRQYLGMVSTTLFGMLYVGFTLSCVMPIRFSNWASAPGSGRHMTFFLFVVLWAGDIFAYFVGLTAGRRAIFPVISPKKTLEGALGGLAGSLVCGWAYARWFWQTADSKTVLPIALLVALAGQAGDLVESALKRSAHLKDSGSLLPGHGGLLDRLDSLLLGAPVLWLALSIKEWVR